jgi:hypothetical protein
MLSMFSSKKRCPSLVRLSTGCFTVDRNGQIVASTLPQAFPLTQVQEIAQRVLKAFHGMQEANLPLTEIIVNYSSLILTARELRGGAIVYLSTRSLAHAAP